MLRQHCEAAPWPAGERVWLAYLQWPCRLIHLHELPPLHGNMQGPAEAAPRHIILLLCRDLLPHKHAHMESGGCASAGAVSMQACSSPATPYPLSEHVLNKETRAR